MWFIIEGEWATMKASGAPGSERCVHMRSRSNWHTPPQPGRFARLHASLRVTFPPTPPTPKTICTGIVISTKMKMHDARLHGQ